MDDEKIVFVTVGTTQFEGLVQAVMKRDVLEILLSKGYTSMIIQFGNGTYVPNEGIRHGIVISTFRFKDDILSYFQDADLVISHAGAASCLESLELGKPLITVVNDMLMNNHQVELAEALSEQGWCSWCYPRDLNTTVEQFDTSALSPYIKGHTKKLIDYIDTSFIMKND